MLAALPLSIFCTIIFFLLRRFFNAPSSSLAMFLSRDLQTSLYDEKAESMCLLLINYLSKLDFSKESISLCQILHHRSAFVKS